MNPQPGRPAADSWWEGVSLQEARAGRALLAQAMRECEAGKSVDGAALARALAVQQLLADDNAVETALACASGLVDAVHADFGHKRVWQDVQARVDAAAVLVHAIASCLDMLGPQGKQPAWHAPLLSVKLKLADLARARAGEEIEELRRIAKEHKLKI